MDEQNSNKIGDQFQELNNLSPEQLLQAQKLTQLILLMNELGLNDLSQISGSSNFDTDIPYTTEELQEFNPYDDFFEEKDETRIERNKEKTAEDYIRPYEEVTISSILEKSDVKLSSPVIDAHPLLTIEPDYLDTPQKSLLEYIDRLEQYPRLSLEGFIKYACEEDDEYRYFLQEANKLSEAQKFIQLEELIFDYHYDGQRELYEKRGVLFSSQVSYYTLWEKIDAGKNVTLYICDADIANVTLRLCIYEKNGKWGYYVSDLALGEYTYIAEPGFVMTRGGLAWMFLVSFVCNYIHNPWIVSKVNDSLLFMTKEDYFRANGIEWRYKKQEEAFVAEKDENTKSVADFIYTKGVIANSFDENNKRDDGYMKMAPFTGEARQAMYDNRNNISNNMNANNQMSRSMTSDVKMSSVGIPTAGMPSSVSTPVNAVSPVVGIPQHPPITMIPQGNGTIPLTPAQQQAQMASQQHNINNGGGQIENMITEEQADVSTEEDTSQILVRTPQQIASKKPFGYEPPVRTRQYPRQRIEK